MDTQMNSIEIPYHPRPLQLQLEGNLKRFNVLVAHRRFGKTVFCINLLLKKTLTSPHLSPRGAYVAPLYRQAKTIAWDMLKFYSRPIPGVKFNEAELRADYPNGARIQLFGSDSPDHLRGIGLDIAVLDEYAQMIPRVWSEIIRPALSDRLGSAIFMGTPQGRNHFHTMYIEARKQQILGNSEWFAATYKASETGIIPDSELESARTTMGQDEYDQEYECSFDAAIKGAYYSRELQFLRENNRICAVPHDDALPVTTAWDLGINDATAIWYAQRSGKEIRLFRYEEYQDVPLLDIAKIVLAHKYQYQTHILPHDAQAREMTTGKTRVESLTSIGLVPNDVARKQSIEEGIHQTRTLLRKAWIDHLHAQQGLAMLESYQKQWDERNGTFRDRPVHNFASHGADALRTLATEWSDLPRRGETGYTHPRIIRTIGGKRTYRRA